jgi:hypothetical protein
VEIGLSPIALELQPDGARNARLGHDAFSQAS